MKKCVFVVGFNAVGMPMIRCKTHCKSEGIYDKLKHKCAGILINRLEKILNIKKISEIKTI